jgi:magnesium chelatase subunit D
VLVLPADLDLETRPPIAGAYAIALDASASGGAARIVAVRGAVSALLADGEERGDRIGVVVLREAGAGTIVPATGSAERARRQLAVVPGGGRPALAAGLRAALRMAVEEATRPDAPVPLVVLVSDGLGLKAVSEAVVPAARVAALGLPALVVDTSPAERKESALSRIAEVMRARLLRLPDPEPEVLAAAMRGALALAAREARWRAPRGRR